MKNSKEQTIIFCEDPDDPQLLAKIERNLRLIISKPEPRIRPRRKRPSGAWSKVSAQVRTLAQHKAEHKAEIEELVRSPAMDLESFMKRFVDIKCQYLERVAALLKKFKFRSFEPRVANWEMLEAFKRHLKIPDTFKGIPTSTAKAYETVLKEALVQVTSRPGNVPKTTWRWEEADAIKIELQLIQLALRPGDTDCTDCAKDS